MVATTFSEIQQGADRRSLIRKAQRAVAFLAPTSVAVPDTITDATGLPVALPTGWLPVGIVTPDGYTFASNVDKDEIDALGYASFVRSDIVKVARTVQFTSLERFRKHMLELQYGMDLSAVEQALANGEISFEEPDMPIGAEWRLIVLADDGPVANNWVFGKCYPNVKLADVGDEKWAKTGGIEQEYTLDVFTDEVLGYPVKHYIAGTGAKAAATDLGFTQGT